MQPKTRSPQTYEWYAVLVGKPYCHSADENIFDNKGWTDMEKITDFIKKNWDATLRFNTEMMEI